MISPWTCRYHATRRTEINICLLCFSISLKSMFTSSKCLFDYEMTWNSHNIIEDEKLRITLARWNPSEVNPPPSHGKRTKKTHFGTDFIHNIFSIDKRKSDDVQTGNIVPTCLEIFEHNRARVWSIWTPPSSSSYPKENICKMNQFVTNHYWGESVWSIRASFLSWKVN